MTAFKPKPAGCFAWAGACAEKRIEHSATAMMGLIWYPDGVGHSITVSIRVCHTRDPGSIPGDRADCLFFVI